MNSEIRMSTNISEFDRVLGGGKCIGSDDEATDLALSNGGKCIGSGDETTDVALSNGGKCIGSACGAANNESSLAPLGGGEGGGAECELKSSGISIGRPVCRVGGGG